MISEVKNLITKKEKSLKKKVTGVTCDVLIPVYNALIILKIDFQHNRIFESGEMD